MSKTEHRKRMVNTDKIDSKLARKKQRTLKIVKQRTVSDYDGEYSIYYRKR